MTLLRQSGRPASTPAATRLGWEPESRSQKVPNDEPEGVQRGIKGAARFSSASPPTMNWHGQASSKRGRRPTFSD
jgi:hypothetical protein